MGKRKIELDITAKAKSLSFDLHLDLSNLPDIEVIRPHVSRDKIGATFTFDLLSILEYEAVQSAGECNEVFVLDGAM